MNPTDFSMFKFNIPVSITKEFAKGKIDRLYRDMYRVADELSTADATRFMSKKTADYFDSFIRELGDKSQPASTAGIQQQIADYKSKRLDYHINKMIHLLELYVQTKQK